MRYVWNQDYETGNTKIDDQHRLIFDAANMLSEAVRHGKEEGILNKAFDLLLSYVNTHFSDEEAYYEEIHSTLLLAQKDEHQSLINELREIWYERRHGSTDAGTDLDHWMEKRLIPHIIAEDTQAQHSTG